VGFELEVGSVGETESEVIFENLVSQGEFRFSQELRSDYYFRWGYTTNYECGYIRLKMKNRSIRLSRLKISGHCQFRPDE
jgi:uncharacterized membrane protein YciS (DUF1049 family)